MDVGKVLWTCPQHVLHDSTVAGAECVKRVHTSEYCSKKNWYIGEQIEPNLAFASDYSKQNHDIHDQNDQYKSELDHGLNVSMTIFILSLQ